MKVRLRDAGNYIAFLSELRRFERMPGGGKVPWRDLYPRPVSYTHLTLPTIYSV